MQCTMYYVYYCYYYYYLQSKLFLTINQFFSSLVRKTKTCYYYCCCCLLVCLFCVCVHVCVFFLFSLHIISRQISMIWASSEMRLLFCYLSMMVDPPFLFFMRYYSIWNIYVVFFSSLYKKKHISTASLVANFFKRSFWVSLE